MTFLAITLGPMFLTWSALLLFIVTSGVTLCFGHSVGMHRRLIHSSFDCPLWLEHSCVYLGTLVGMAGPYGMIRLHDFRDWAQRQAHCHDYSCHRAGFWRDAWWQLHCRLVLRHPPEFRLEPRLANDRVLRLRRTNVDVAAIALGDAVLRHRRLELAGLGHLRAGQRLRDRPLADRPFLPSKGRPELDHRWRWRPKATMSRLAGLISMGESWHNNHHAFPGSAKIGPLPGPDRSRLVADQGIR